MLVGPLIAVLSFVCSVGNIPLAAVLWSGGIGFAGVVAFIFADLIVLPIVAIYRKYYGTSFALRIVALMLLTMVLAALAVDGLFSAAGLIPHTRPTRSRSSAACSVDYKLVTNVLGAVIFVSLFALTDAARRHRPDLRHEGRPPRALHDRARRAPLLLPALRRRLRRRAPAPRAGGWAGRCRARPWPDRRRRRPARDPAPTGAARVAAARRSRAGARAWPNAPPLRGCGSCGS